MLERVEEMTPAELRLAREGMGLSPEALAALLGVELRTLRRWEGGATRVPTGAVADVRRLQERTQAEVAAGVQALRDQPAAEPVASSAASGDPGAGSPAGDRAGEGPGRERRQTPVQVTYYSDEHFHTAHPEDRPWPASWHRRVSAQVAAAVPGTRVVYAETPPDGPRST